MNTDEIRPLSKEAKKLLKYFKHGKIPIDLHGSASLKAMKYFSDYDFNAVITIDNPKNLYNQIIRVFKRMSNDKHMFPIDVEIKLKNGKKIMFHPPIHINYDVFKKVYKDIEYIQLDFVTLLKSGRLIEVSMSYQTKETDKVGLVDSLMDAKVKFDERKNYYKGLKRYFEAARLKKDKKSIDLLTDFFNSEVGQLYEVKANLDAIKLLKKTYKKNPLVKELIKQNMKNLHPIDLRNYADIEKFVNEQARKFALSNNIM